jgi:hypothetical protein
MKHPAQASNPTKTSKPAPARKVRRKHRQTVSITSQSLLNSRGDDLSGFPASILDGSGRGRPSKFWDGKTHEVLISIPWKKSHRTAYEFMVRVPDLDLLNEWFRPLCFSMRSARKSTLPFMKPANSGAIDLPDSGKNYERLYDMLVEAGISDVWDHTRWGIGVLVQISPQPPGWGYGKTQSTELPAGWGFHRFNTEETEKFVPYLLPEVSS